MSHEERNTVFQIFIGVCVNAYIIRKLLDLDSAGAFDGPDAVMIWARTVLWTILFSVAFGIVVVIFGNILLAIVNRDPKPSFVVDERDNMIENTGNRVAVACICFGFMGALVAMAFGVGAIGGLTAILLSFSIGSMIGEIGKLVRYRMAI
jgi:hypothetical protein